MKGLVASVSLACLLAVAPARAQSYPTKPITMVVTAAAGGVTDVVARALAQHLSEAWKQQVIVENRGGAAHSQAMTVVARSAAGRLHAAGRRGRRLRHQPGDLSEGQARVR